LRARIDRAKRALYAFAGFCCAFAVGLYMVWKIIRTPGSL
jgi:hypothetical protein